MHPILANSQNRLVYIVAWGMIGLLLAALLAVPGDMTWKDAIALSIPMALVLGFISLSARYLCNTFTIQRTPWPKLLLIHLLAAGLSSSLWILIVTLLGAILAQFETFAALATIPASAVRLLFGSGMLLFMLAVSVHYLIGAFETSRDAERRSLELHILAQTAELKALRAQIQPHFLFNSLNSISALTSSDPAGARSMTLRLAAFLRTTLSAGGREAIPLAEEIALANEYLGIEKVRFGDRLRVEIVIDPEVEEKQVPPLLLQPLLENAIRHGIAQMIEGGTLTIHARPAAHRVHLTIVNPYDPLQSPRAGIGLGIQNVRYRLEKLYGNDARVDIVEGTNTFTVELKIPA